MAKGLKEQDRPRHSGVQAGDLTGHGDSDEEVNSPTYRGRKPTPLRADHDTEWPAEVRLSIPLGGLSLGTNHPNAPKAEGGEFIGEVLDTGDQEVLDRSGTGLDGRWRKWGGPLAADEEPVHPHRLGAADEATEILGVLYPVERQDEGGLSACHGAGEKVFGGGLRAALHDQGDPLVPIEPGQLADEGTLDLNNWNAQGGGVEDHLLEGVPSLRHHQEANRFTAGGEGLLYWSASSDHLVLRADHARNLKGNSSARRPLLGATGTKGRAYPSWSETPWPTWTSRAA